MLTFLKGKKTFLCAAALFVLGGLKALNVIDQLMFEALAAMLTAGGIAALRAAK